jgi:hypothetical protein
MLKKHWEAFEKDVAERLGLRRTISSGNKFFDPGDAVSEHGDRFPLYADAKCTEAKSFTLKSHELRDYTRRALEAGKTMILPVRFFSKVGHHEDYVVLGLDDFQMLLDLARTA